MKEKEIIPIVFATDDGYAPYLGVVLQSLITHASQNNFYQIYILYTTLTAEHKRRLCGMGCDYVAIDCVDVTEQTAQLGDFTTHSWLPVETTYRLLLSELFPQYDKILYLDCDIIILDDVAKLYQHNLEGSVLGVAELAVEKNTLSHWTEVLHLDLEEAFNAGVLLFHTKLFREEKIQEKCMALLVEDWKKESPQFVFQDQDVLNLVCRGKTSRFSMAWNLEWYMDMTEKGTLFQVTEETRPAYDKAKENPKLIHFTSPWKAWGSPECEYADIFYKYARETVFYEEILLKETKPKKIPQNRLFPWHLVDCGSRVVIYGGGNVGESYLYQLSMTNYCQVCAICDQNAEAVTNFLLPVVRKDELSALRYDAIVIAVLDQGTAQKVKEDLVFMGIPEEKIKWR